MAAAQATQRAGAFKPEEHFRNLKGQQYLEVKWRVVWFREQHGDDGAYITTDLVYADYAAGHYVFKARVGFFAGDGREVYATGYGSETVKDFADATEKAETKAIGRALAMLGYGTAQAIELDEGERTVADAPATGRGQGRGNLSAVPPADPPVASTAPPRVAQAPPRPMMPADPDIAALRTELAEWYDRYPDREAQVDAFLKREGKGWSDALVRSEVDKMRQRAADEEAQRAAAAQEAAVTDPSPSDELAGALEVTRQAVEALSKKRGGPTAGDYEGMRVVLRELQRCDPLPDDTPPEQIPPKLLLDALRTRLAVADAGGGEEGARAVKQEIDEAIPF